jgi:predicted phage baseplate assembly protein
MSGGPALPRRSARRDELLERLLVTVTTARGSSLALRERTLADPTIALLDAWATVEDVLGFYLDRIADEGFLATAREPGSILALAELAGHRPRPGTAAHLHLAYELNADPDDKAVLLSAGLLSQSVAGPGEQPQAFETTGTLLARPSWNVLSPKRSRPLAPTTVDEAQALDKLVVAGTTAGLASNDVILLDVAGAARPALLRVAAAQVDATAGVTNVVLQDGAGAQARAAPEAGPADVTGAIDTLIEGGLAKPPAPVPAARSDLRRNVATVFSPDSDATPRLLSALRPAVARTLYKALDDTALGSPAVGGASVLRVKAAPFGGQAPPRVLFDERGQPAGTEDWPIGDTHTLRLSITSLDFAVALQRALGALGAGDEVGARLRARVERLLRTSESSTAAGDPVVDVGCDVAALSRQATIALTPRPPWTPADLGLLGELDVSIEDERLVLHYRGTDAASVRELTVTATLDVAGDAVVLQLDGGETYTWDPEIRTPVRTQIGGRRLSIVWSTGGLRAADGALTFSIETPLAVAETTTLALDGVYGGILPDTTVVIERAASPGEAPDAAEGDIAYPVIARVNSADTVAVSRYGITAKVTQLALNTSWIGPRAVLQSALRSLTVRAQPDPLELVPVPIHDDLTHDAIELDTLVAGMEAGRLIIVRGTRADLPVGAGVQAGEVAMVAGVTNGGGDGEHAHTTLHLAAPLAYGYRRDSVQIFGNVVAAHQGATIDEVLGSGNPSKPRQSFTLSASAPLLADPSPTGAGTVSSLTVTVDGVGYQEVERFDSATPPRSFLTRNDPQGHVTITFAGPLPAGTENVRASYRAGDGRAGNVRPDQVTQLLTRPAGVAGVSNPLPGSGGRAGDGPEAVRAAGPVGLRGLGRVVTASDYADLAASLPGVGKACAEMVSDGRGPTVLVTVAGTDPVPLDAQGSVCTGVRDTLTQAADPLIPLAVLPAALFVIVLGASVTRDPLVGWHETEGAVRSALLSAFGYARRELGQDVALGDLIAAAHSVPSVLSFVVTALALVPATASASDIAEKLPAMLSQPVPQVLTLEAAAAASGAGQPPALAAAGLAYLSESVSDTLILTESPA